MDQRAYDKGRWGLGLPANEDQREGRRDREWADATQRDAEKYEPTPSTSVSGGGGGIGFVILVGLGVGVFTILYPLTVATAVAAAAAPQVLLGLLLTREQQQPWQVGVAALCSLILGFWTLWRASRLDHQIADDRRGYRWFRHALRIVMVFVLLVGVLGEMPENDIDPVRLGIAGAGLLGAHLFLWYCDGIQETWHGLLETCGLRREPRPRAPIVPEWD